ncbi:MAG: hypothetical protein AMXMBFR84_47520 [Candidatus Hydrogenedentota bacterium]
MRDGWVAILGTIPANETNLSRKIHPGEYARPEDKRIVVQKAETLHV